MCLILHRRFPCQTQQGEEIEVGPHDIYFLLFDALHNQVQVHSRSNDDVNISTLINVNVRLGKEGKSTPLHFLANVIVSVNFISLCTLHNRIKQKKR